ncbi:MAG: hypothetical protein ABUL48_06625, partial [Pseudorhodoplanes sp.]
VPQEVADAVNDKQRNDEIQTARLIASGTPVAPIKTNVDGGMNPVFVAALNSSANVGRDTQGDVAVIAPIKTPLGTIPTSVNPPRQPDLQIATTEPAGTVVADVPLPRIAPRPKEGMRTEEPSFAEKLGSLFRPAEAKPAAEAPRVASSEPTSQPEPKKSGSLFSRSTTGSAPRAADHKAAETQPKEGITAKISRKLGLRGTETATTDETPKAAPAAQVNTTGSIWPQPKPVDPAPKPAATASANGGLMAGAQPAPASSSFDSRFAVAQ